MDSWRNGAARVAPNCAAARAPPDVGRVFPRPNAWKARSRVVGDLARERARDAAVGAARARSPRAGDFGGFGAAGTDAGAGSGNRISDIDGSGSGAGAAAAGAGAGAAAAGAGAGAGAGAAGGGATGGATIIGGAIIGMPYGGYDGAIICGMPYEGAIIICGGSAYPRDWDYAKFREVRDDRSPAGAF